MTAEPFLQGISMPIHGLDHMLVTIAVGLIAAQLGGKALWAIPGIFTVSVLLGGILNIMGVPVPLAECGILASIAVFGGLLAWGSRLSILLALCLTVLFALCHGSALIANDTLVQNMPAFVAGCLFSALLLQGGRHRVGPSAPTGVPTPCLSLRGLDDANSCGGYRPLSERQRLR